MYIRTFENYKKSDQKDDQEYQYQFRDIGKDGMYLKRKKGEDIWKIITKEEFEKSGVEKFDSVIKYDKDDNKV
jgi:hypothetical protein